MQKKRTLAFKLLTATFVGQQYYENALMSRKL